MEGSFSVEIKYLCLCFHHFYLSDHSLNMPTSKLSREVCNPVRFELQAVCWGFCSWSLSRWPTQFQPCPWWVECHILNGLCSSQLHGVQFDPLRVGWCQPVLQSTLFLSRFQINYSHIPLVLLIHKCWWGCQPAFAQPVLGLWCFNPGQKSEHVCHHSFCLMIQRMALNIASGPCFMYIHLISSPKQTQDMFDGSWNDFIPLVVVHICPEDWYVQYWRLIDFNLRTSGLCSNDLSFTYLDESNLDQSLVIHSASSNSTIMFFWEKGSGNRRYPWTSKLHEHLGLTPFVFNDALYPVMCSQWCSLQRGGQFDPRHHRVVIFNLDVVWVGNTKSLQLCLSCFLRKNLAAFAVSLTNCFFD